MNKIIAILADGKIVLSFFMRGYLLSPFSLIVRSFGQVSFGHLAKSARYFSHSSKSISSDRLPLPLYVIYIKGICHSNQSVRSRSWRSMATTVIWYYDLFEKGAIYYLPIEYYAPLPSSIMLICHRVLCSFDIEYYAHLTSSIMLI